MTFNLNPRRFAFTKNLFAAALLGAAVLFAGDVRPGHAEAAQSIEVVVDHAKVMRISQPAATVIIGNPGIADATVQDDKTLVITGKSFGVTNLIVMDDKGDVLADALVTVRGDRINAVTVYRRTERETYSCSPNCERSLALGDGSETFGNVQTQIQQRNTFANGSQ